jgi:uncharacterized protein YjbJ (UPF0337 family)
MGTMINRPPQPEGARMTDKHIDEAKGRVKEAAGSLSGDESLKNDGRADQARASVKDTVDTVADKAKGLLDEKEDR